MQHSELKGRIEGYAENNDLSITWEEVANHFDDELDEVSSYHQRRLASWFENWITRRRKSKKAPRNGDNPKRDKAKP